MEKKTYVRGVYSSQRLEMRLRDMAANSANRPKSRRTRSEVDVLHAGLKGDESSEAEWNVGCAFSAQLVFGLVGVAWLIHVGTLFAHYAGVGYYVPTFVLNSMHLAGYAAGRAQSSMLRSEISRPGVEALIFSTMGCALMYQQWGQLTNYGGVASWGNLLNGTVAGYRNVTRAQGTPINPPAVNWQFAAFALFCFASTCVMFIFCGIISLVSVPRCWRVPRSEEFEESYFAYLLFQRKKTTVNLLTDAKEDEKNAKAVDVKPGSDPCWSYFAEMSVWRYNVAALWALISRVFGVLYGVCCVVEFFFSAVNMRDGNAMVFPTFDSPFFALSVCVGVSTDEVTYLFARTRRMYGRPTLVVALTIAHVVAIVAATVAFVNEINLINASGDAWYAGSCGSACFHGGCAGVTACYAALQSTSGPFVDKGNARFFLLGPPSPSFASNSYSAYWLQMSMLVFGWFVTIAQIVRTVTLCCTYEKEMNTWNGPADRMPVDMGCGTTLWYQAFTFAFNFEAVSSSKKAPCRPGEVFVKCCSLPSGYCGAHAANGIGSEDEDEEEDDEEEGR